MNIVQELEKALAGAASHIPEIFGDLIRTLPSLASQIGSLVFSVAAGQEAMTPGISASIAGHHGKLALVWTPEAPQLPVAPAEGHVALPTTPE